MFNHWYAPFFFLIFFNFYENWLIVRLLFAEIVLIYSVFTTVVGTFFFLTVLFTSSSLCLHFPDTRHALYPVCDLISNVSHAGRCFRPQIVLFLVKITSTTNYTDYLWGEKNVERGCCRGSRFNIEFAKSSSAAHFLVTGIIVFSLGFVSVE